MSVFLLFFGAVLAALAAGLFALAGAAGERFAANTAAEGVRRIATQCVVAGAVVLASALVLVWLGAQRG